MSTQYTIDWNVIRQEVAWLQGVLVYWKKLSKKTPKLISSNLNRDWDSMGEAFDQLSNPIAHKSRIPTIVAWLEGCKLLKGNPLTAIFEERERDCKRIEGFIFRVLKRGWVDKDVDPLLSDLALKMVEYLTEYIGELGKLLGEAGPEKFTFLGFKIENPNRVTHDILIQILDAVKYTSALFDKKGVKPVLVDSVKSFRIVFKDTVGTSMVNFTALGRYRSGNRSVDIMTQALDFHDAARMLKRWVDEIFVHEIGHHVHMSLLPPQAVADWDEPWEQAVIDPKAKRDAIAKALHNRALVTYENRVGYFDLTQKLGWNLSAVSKHLSKDKFEQKKFLEFLRMAALSKSRDKVSLTDMGRSMVDFAKDPQSWMDRRKPHYSERERKEEAERMWGVLKSRYFFLDRTDGAMVVMGFTDIENMANWMAEEQLVDHDPRNLQSPTDYAKTNKYEDFAETFVAFLTRPDMLSSTAKFRMQRALSLSGLYGKEIMKLGSHSRKACIIAAGQWGGHLCLLKNRDRNYTPKIKVIHELIDDVEVAYFLDTETDWSEGMNEHGFAIVNSALQVKADENERKNIQKGIKKSKDGERIRAALSKTTIEDCIKTVSTFKSGVKGHTFVTDGAKVWSIEQTSKHENITEEIDPGTLHVRTNHGYNHEDAGYSEGENLISSLNRREKAEKLLRKVKSPEKIGPALMDARKEDRKNPNNLVRATDNMKTSSQLVMDASRLKMWLYVIPEQADFLTVENKLPKGRTPKIKVQVFEYTKTDKKKVGIDKVSSVQSVVSRYLDSKGV